MRVWSWRVRTGANIPFDSKSGDAGLLGEDVAPDALEEGSWGRVVVQLLVVVLVVHIVADADKLVALIGAREKNHRHAEDLVGGDLLQGRGGGCEDEFVDALRYRADRDLLEVDVVLVGLGGADVGELPVDVCEEGENLLVIVSEG